MTRGTAKRLPTNHAKPRLMGASSVGTLEAGKIRSFRVSPQPNLRQIGFEFRLHKILFPNALYQIRNWRAEQARSCPVCARKTPFFRSPSQLVGPVVP
jgi:hypothetical protein